MLWDVDIWSEMERLRRDMNSLFADFGRSGGATTYPLANVYDGKDAIVITAELPGMTRDKVNITLAPVSHRCARSLFPVKPRSGHCRYHPLLTSK